MSISQRPIDFSILRRGRSADYFSFGGCTSKEDRKFEKARSLANELIWLVIMLLDNPISPDDLARVMSLIDIPTYEVDLQTRCHVTDNVVVPPRAWTRETVLKQFPQTTIRTLTTVLTSACNRYLATNPNQGTETTAEAQELRSLLGEVRDLLC